MSAPSYHVPTDLEIEPESSVSAINSTEDDDTEGLKDLADG